MSRVTNSVKAALRCVFTYLDTPALLAVGAACRVWRNVSRHSSLWVHVTLENTHISSTLLVSLSRWCSQTRSLTMRNLSTPRRYQEGMEEHYRRTRGSLEAGLETLLRATGRSLLELTVMDCPNILTDRCVWLASCYCRSLHTLTYRSATDPVGPEVIWALGAGCRNISSLQVAPLQPCLQPSRFGNRCLQLIGRCWPQLSEVGVGGAYCGVQGLVSLVRSCGSLRRLQLHGVCEVSVCVAQQLCREGLRCLETLEFHSTPVSPDALLHFHSMCGQLRCVLVQASISDYFQDPDREEAHRHFNQTINKMQRCICAGHAGPGCAYQAQHVTVEDASLVPQIQQEIKRKPGMTACQSINLDFVFGWKNVEQRRVVVVVVVGGWGVWGYKYGTLSVPLSLPWARLHPPL
ncbi:hypothetical protein ACEWY4_025106 [Coilia grayii]|uniref:F-box domain-containing protein n=1 Tax=Coilia grayii TaxID=363190 RepID=A0ABD1IWY6_9TELE